MTPNSNLGIGTTVAVRNLERHQHKPKHWPKVDADSRIVEREYVREDHPTSLRGKDEVLVNVRRTDGRVASNREAVIAE
jgi:hypothetical protein